MGSLIVLYPHKNRAAHNGEKEDKKDKKDYGIRAHFFNANYANETNFMIENFHTNP